MDKIKCPSCGTDIEVNPASLMGKRKKTMTEAAIKARKDNAKKRWDKIKKEGEND